MENSQSHECKEVTRFEVIDDTGRVLVKYGVSVELSFQDEGRTLKVFLTNRDVVIDENKC